jgi:hypothetical protein
MNTRVLSPYLILVCLSLATFGCWGPADLIGGFRSHMSPAEVQAVLKARGSEWEVIEEGGLPPGDQRPRYSGAKWRASRFADLGFAGYAEFEFFNDRLAAVSFFPDSFDAYLSELDPQAKAQIGQPLRLSWDPRVNARVGSNHEGRRCVTWESVQLREEDRRWIADHG